MRKTPRELAEAAVTKASQKFDELSERLTKDRAQLAHALERHAETRSPASSQAVAYARTDEEATAAALVSAERSLADSRTLLAKMERDEQTARYQAAAAKASAVRVQLAPHFEKLASLQAQIFGTLLDVGALVGDGSDAYAEAESLARDLGLASEFRSVPRTTLADARLLAQEQLDAARARDSLEPVHEWLAPSGTDWRNRDMTPAERAEVQAFASRQRAAADLAERDNATADAYRHGVVDAPRLAKIEAERLEKAKLERPRTEGVTP